LGRSPKRGLGRDLADRVQLRARCRKPARLSDVAVVDGEAYGIGYATDANDVQHWMVVRGPGVVSDQFALAPGQAAGGVRLGGKTALFAVGYASDGQSTTGVVRRRSATGQWSTIDSFGARAADIVQVGSQLIVVGTVQTPERMTIRTRRSDDGGTTWQTMGADYYYGSPDFFAGQQGLDAAPVALTADPQGNVYAAVMVTDVNNNLHLNVVRLACE
jgi:hypothetical protein